MRKERNGALTIQKLYLNGRQTPIVSSVEAGKVMRFTGNLNRSGVSGNGRGRARVRVPLLCRTLPFPLTGTGCPAVGHFCAKVIALFLEWNI